MLDPCIPWEQISRYTGFGCDGPNGLTNVASTFETRVQPKEQVLVEATHVVHWPRVRLHMRMQFLPRTFRFSASVEPWTSEPGMLAHPLVWYFMEQGFLAA